jgi:hypothetical protein
VRTPPASPSPAGAPDDGRSPLTPAPRDGGGAYDELPYDADNVSSPGYGDGPEYKHDDEAAWSSDDDKDWDDRDDELITIPTTKVHWLRGELARTFCISATDIATLNASTERETMRVPLEEVIWVGESKTDPRLFKLRIKQGRRKPRQLLFRTESKADKERLVATLSMLVHAHRTKRHRRRGEAASGYWTGGELGAVVRVKKPVRRRSTIITEVGEEEEEGEAS